MPTSTQSDRARAKWAQTTPEAKAARMAPAVRANKYRGAENYIRRLVEQAPPLTAEQRDRLALLLTGSATPGGDR